MLLLTGEYEHTVDGKSRVLISNKLRNQIDADEHGSNFYLVLGANGILCLYPEKYFEQIVLAVAPNATAPDEAVAFERISFALASKVELDGQGRLLLNEKLRKRAGLKSTSQIIWLNTRNRCRRQDRLFYKSKTKKFKFGMEAE
jgi:MraZ protein